MEEHVEWVPDEERGRVKEAEDAALRADFHRLAAQSTVSVRNVGRLNRMSLTCLASGGSVRNAER